MAGMATQISVHNPAMISFLRPVFGRLAGTADLTALRATFPFLLRFDQWLAGSGQNRLATALGGGQAIGPS
jgi:hypothetical protein